MHWQNIQRIRYNNGTTLINMHFILFCFGVVLFFFSCFPQFVFIGFDSVEKLNWMVIFTVDVHSLTANDSRKTYTLYYDEWKIIWFIVICSSVFWQQQQQIHGWTPISLFGWILYVSLSLSLAHTHTLTLSLWLWHLYFANNFQRAVTSTTTTTTTTTTKTTATSKQYQWIHCQTTHLHTHMEREREIHIRTHACFQSHLSY